MEMQTVEPTPLFIPTPSKLDIKRKDILAAYPEDLIPNAELRGRAIPPTAAEVEALMQSIKRHGQLQAITVRLTGKQYRVIAGETRRQAIALWNTQLAPGEERHRILMQIATGNDEELFLATIAENRDRNPTTPIDDAVNCRTLIERFHKSTVEVSRIYGKSPAWVTQRLKLLDLSDEERLAIHSGHLATAGGELLASIPTEDRPTVLALAQERAVERESRKKPDLSAGVSVPLSGPAEPMTPEDAVKANLERLKTARVTSSDVRAAARATNTAAYLRPKTTEIAETFAYVLKNSDKSFTPAAVGIARAMLAYIEGKETDSAVFEALHRVK